MCYSARSARKYGNLVVSAQAARPAQLHHRNRWQFSFAQSCRALRDSRGPLHNFLRGALIFCPPARIVFEELYLRNPTDYSDQRSHASTRGPDAHAVGADSRNMSKGMLHFASS